MLLHRPLPSPSASMHAAPTMPVSAALASPNIALEDCGVLLAAVMARLRQTVGAYPGAATQSPRDEEAGRVQASVLECVAALDQLHATLMHELDRCVRQRTDSL